MLIILDRDGVINEESIEYVKSPEEWIPIESSLQAVAALSRAGCSVVVATNQSGVGRGYYTLETLQAIHDKMCAEVAKRNGHIEKIYFCPHKPNDGCSCRKPAPGLLLQIAKDFNVDLKDAVFIGDSWRDIQAAKKVGAKPILVKTGHGEQTLQGHADIDDIAVYNNLAEAADDLLKGGMQ